MNRNLLKKITIVFIIAGCAAVFFTFDLNRYLTLSYIKESRETFYNFYTGNKVLTIGIYMLIYIAVTALSLPGAAVMTLAGGALFGFFIGLAAVSFASTIGATLACFVSRYLLRGWVEDKFGDRLSAINAGIEKEGAFYLFMLRLIPVFPFFIINLLMGLTRIKLVTFYWVSQIGMLAGTAVYVNAGKEIGKIDSLSGILSPGLIISFVILGIFPLAVKKIVNVVQAHRA
ncbi:MAG: TVP38/TMEM64 family protein [Spirochaetae bacterium HGW-Spirochaetae-5]|nr:MAG: TVP38/TMEM64 family protein [Spirochaetae bacterium HGW-Spirochaetae-5]